MSTGSHTPRRPWQDIDWSQLWYPGPRRVFTPAEMARAGGDQPSASFVMVLAVTLLGPALALLTTAPDGQGARTFALLVAALVLIWRGAMALWARPTRRRLMALSCVAALLLLGFMLGLRWRLPPGEARSFVFNVAALLTTLAMLGFWVLALFRAHQIEARLREADQREHALQAARQLAAAQVQPHFLANALAALQHWVQVKDDRAAPMLDALHGFLRATLPLFEREQLRLGEELEAARRYLDVMRLRLGERLAVGFDTDPAVDAVLLPPGLLLTLVENAVEHGVQASLHGAEILVRSGRDGPVCWIEVADSGPGLLPGADPEAGRGVGLANARARLALAHGDAARLTLSPRQPGGCLARIELPLTP
ncbi:MAG: histidine kinase [Burkholderiaceae bacterium]|nr:histidine kinase [Burkholderiaceae bacterium]